MHDADTWDPSNRDLVGTRYPRGTSQLVGLLTARFSPVETAAWFEAEGVTLKREADGRVFPSTDDSSTIINALLGAARRSGVELRTNAKVLAVERSSAGFRIRYASRGAASDDDVTVTAPALLLATGSASHGLATQLGHDIVPLVPSLFSFRLQSGGMLDASLAGLSVQDAELELEPATPPSPLSSESDHQRLLRPDVGISGGAGGKKRKRKAKGKKRGVIARGPLLVTHRGVSGPAVLKLSAFAARELHAAGYCGVLRLNLVPSLSGAEVSSQLHRFQAQLDVKAKQDCALATCVGRRLPLPGWLTFSSAPPPAWQVGTVNPFGLPRRLWAVVVRGVPASAECGESGENGVLVDDMARWAQLTDTELAAISERLCGARLAFTGKDSNKDEFVTAGGVSWTGVDAKRMASKLVPGLFFAGELLDVDGITGGHNFQSCWSTGHVAGTAAAEGVLVSV